MTKPNDPNNNQNSPQNESVAEVSSQEIKSQIDLAAQLNNSLLEVVSNSEKIVDFTRTQSGLYMSLVDSFEKIQDAVEDMAINSEIITKNIEKAAMAVLGHLNAKNFETINKSLIKVSKTATDGITSQSQAFKGLSDKSEEFQDANKTLTEQMASNSKDLGSQQSKSQKEANKLKSAAKSINEGFDEMASQAKETSEEIEKLGGGFMAKIKGFMSIVTGGLGTLFNAMGTLVGAAKNFVTFSLSLPFTITSEAAKIGNVIRQDLVEVIQTSVEDLKDKFDLGSHIGEGIVSMGERGKQMLMAFQDPSSEMVKLFGEGAAGIANRNRFMGENVDALGEYSEIFGKSLMSNEKNLIRFTKMVKAFGFSGEDLKLLAIDATNNLNHINEQMELLGNALTTVSKEYGIDRKRLSKNVSILKKDIIQFGHLSYEEITRTAARMTHMKVKMEDAAAVFKKFSTFEDAANSVAMLSQTFGMNLNAMDLLQAKKPEEIFTMFRDAMDQTGRSFDDLNRFEKELMVQHTGMSAESLKALMNYRQMGYSYNEAVAKMNAEKPEAKQMEALKGLNSAVKEIQKVLTFDSPFKAFADGLMANMTLTGGLKDTVTSLSQGYQGIYTYAKGLSPDVWEGIVQPIELVLNVMTDIFNSKGFKKGLVASLKAVSNFVANIFGVTSEDVIFENLRSNVSSVLNNNKIESGVKDKFKAEIGGKISEALSAHKKELGAHITNLDSLIVSKDSLGIIKALKELSKKQDLPANTKEIVKKMAGQISTSLSTIEVKTNDNKIKKAYEGTADQFVKDIKRGLAYNEENASKLSGLSGNIMGAIIMGAGTGFVALLRLANDGIDAAGKFMEQSGDKQVNRVAEFLNVDPKKFEALGDGMNKALKSLFNKKGKLFSIAGWFIGGFTDMFRIIIDVFMNILGTSLKEMFGDIISFKVPPSQALNATKFDLKGQQIGAQRVTDSLKNNPDATLDATDVGSLTHVLESKIGSIKDQKTREVLLKALEAERATFMSSDNTQKDVKKLATFSSEMLKNIKGDKFVGDNIVSVTNKKGEKTNKYMTDQAYMQKAQKNINKFQNFFANSKVYKDLYKEEKIPVSPEKKFPKELINNKNVIRLLSDLDKKINLDDYLKYLNTFSVQKVVDRYKWSDNEDDKMRKFFGSLRSHVEGFDKKNFDKPHIKILKELTTSLFYDRSKFEQSNRIKTNKLKNLQRSNRLQNIYQDMLKGQTVKTTEASKPSLDKNKVSPTALNTKTATTATAQPPIKKEPAVTDSTKSKKATKKQVKEEKEKLQKKKEELKNAEPIKVKGPDATIDAKKMSKELVEKGNMVGELTNPANRQHLDTSTVRSKDLNTPDNNPPEPGKLSQPNSMHIPESSASDIAEFDLL